jgi:translation initiation factor 3 subunit K
VNILLKALVHPETADFTLCLALLDDRPQTSHLDEPDPMPTILPQLNDLHASISGCRFPAFWAAYGSDELQGLRENYTVEVAGFEDSVRAVAARAIAATFTRIALARLGSYLNLEGARDTIACHRKIS